MEILWKSLKAYLKHLRLLGLEEIPIQAPLFEPQDELERLLAQVQKCKSCALHKTRKRPVLGEGNPKALLMFIGEAPGAEEDEQGRPFVGKAGELLTRMIKAMGLNREEFYITNLIKCRPPNNRNPKPEEIEACKPFLLKQLEIIKPKLLCTLGSFAAQSLLGVQEKISSLRGKVLKWQGIILIPTFHPAFLLRNPSYKKFAWEDLKRLMAEYRRLKAEKPQAPPQC